MKKILVLLVAACALFVSCQKEGGNSSVDGSTWEGRFRVSDNHIYDHRLELKGGYASIYEYEYGKIVLRDTRAYKVKGNKISFTTPLYINSEQNVNSPYSNGGTFNEDKSKLKLDLDGGFLDLLDGGYRYSIEFNRVAE